MKINRWGAAAAAGIIAGALAAAAPAAATYDPEPVAEVQVVCDGDDAAATIDGGGTNRGWRVLADGDLVAPADADLGDVPQSDPAWPLWLGPDADPVTVLVPDTAPENVTVEWHWDTGWDAHEVNTDYQVESCPSPEPETTPEPTESASPEPEVEVETSASPEAGAGAGGGDELPETSGLSLLPTLTIGGLLLLAAGGGVWLLARRRRVTFTA